MGTQLLVGFHAVIARLRHAPQSVREVLVHGERGDARLRALVELARQRAVRVMTADLARLDGLTGGQPHQGVVARAERVAQPARLQDLLPGLTEPPFLLLLDGVSDPHNLGACIRTADAMGVHAVVVPKDRSAGLTPTVAKVASGAADRVPLIVVTNLARSIGELQDAGVRVCGAAPDGTEELMHVDLHGPLAWVLGGEGKGLRRLTRERCDLLVRIPMFGQVESLNVSVAAALCLYETRRQRIARPQLDTRA
jgi:23S rRNA (guanosine2251-2'-O)-methyltransferase